MGRRHGGGTGEGVAQDHEAAGGAYTGAARDALDRSGDGALDKSKSVRGDKVGSVGPQDTRRSVEAGTELAVSPGG
jgi:hypothetical protein